MMSRLKGLTPYLRRLRHLHELDPKYVELIDGTHKSNVVEIPVKKKEPVPK